MTRTRYLIFTVTALLILVVDQVSKVYINRSMDLYTTIPVIENYFNITYLRNKGAAFGFLANASYRLPFFILVSLVAIVVIGVVVYRLRPDQKLASFCLALILSGAVGNLIDRVRLGEVIDFIDVHWYQYHYPAFNIADSAICVGVFLLAVDMFREEKRQKSLNAGHKAP